MICENASGSSCSASSIEPFTSANSTVTCLRSPSSAGLRLQDLVGEVFGRVGARGRIALPAASSAVCRAETRTGCRTSRRADSRFRTARSPTSAAQRTRCRIWRPVDFHGRTPATVSCRLHPSPRCSLIADISRPSPSPAAPPAWWRPSRRRDVRPLRVRAARRARHRAAAPGRRGIRDFGLVCPRAGFVD